MFNGVSETFINKTAERVIDATKALDAETKSTILSSINWLTIELKEQNERIEKIFNILKDTVSEADYNKIMTLYTENPSQGLEDISLDV